MEAVADQSRSAILKRLVTAELVVDQAGTEWPSRFRKKKKRKRKWEIEISC